MSQSTKFWDKIADKYSKQPIADEVSYQKKLRVTQEYFKPGWSVLEFGCGTGGTAIIHAPHVKNIRAIDISSAMIKIAKSKAEAKGIDNVTFEQLTIEELALEDSTYDAVLGLSILHLLEDKEKAIAKVYQMLKPEGVFVTSTTCMADAYSWFKLIAPIGRALGFFPAVKIFTVQHLIESLTDAGFAIDYQWQPSKGKAIFIVAKKPE
ncbi:MAG: class I SAM-dependent methyltransferase [Cyanobacteria bacterium J06600_6]